MRLTRKDYNKTYDDKNILADGGRIVDLMELKLGQLKNIEDELGIEIVLLWKAVKQDYIYMNIKENNKGIDKIIKMEVGGFLYDEKDKVWRLTSKDRYDGAYWGTLATTKNYGKTWALTKEEL